MPKLDTKNKPRIIGGTLADTADHPGVVGIRSTFLGQDQNGVVGWFASTCTGTVLSPTKVLTAAHCAVDLPFGTTTVIAGRNNINLNSGGFVARVATTWTHQSFNLAALYQGTAEVPVDDVSVLTLKDALPAAYTPVNLSAQGDQTPYAGDTQASIVGYGVTDPNATGAAGILYAAEVPMVSDAECTGVYGTHFDAARMVCAGLPSAGVDTCHGDSGGPIFVEGRQVGITDWGLDPCATTYGVYERISFYANLINQDLGRTGLVNMDWAGDGHSDLFGRQTDGRLVQGSGSGLSSDGYGGFSGFSLFAGPGWNTFNKILRVNNWTGDGSPSIFARDAAGKLWHYRSDGKGNLVGGRIQIGTGWGGFTELVATNNWTGDGRPNIIGRKANGDLMLYTSNGRGGWANSKGTKIGTSWNAFNTLVTPGSWMGDGKQSLIARKPNGELWLYNSNGRGGWSNPRGTLIGTGWKSFKIFMSPGDWSGDNMIDLVGVTADGTVRLYTTNGKGAWLDGRGPVIDTGWNVFNAVF